MEERAEERKTIVKMITLEIIIPGHRKKVSKGVRETEDLRCTTREREAGVTVELVLIDG